ncbi:hypothetical protein DSC45_18560 [Streptomyces sp. YIM 130001]|uniref:ATP-binding protein n=1 Tax=Streptomyces sp. YIM 130001 TaxID=2259644 RepID=UPI000E647CEA|nr:ATP-binding protein [Streptomyces sp. YIM 130001]RII15308.1 hypothetical protein DSC45_18560 [Streptomyces sp. YIM 130001]
MNQGNRTHQATPQFSILLSSTPRGARLARLLAERQLAEWKRESSAALHVVAELATNAVRHGRVRGRDFRLRLALSSTHTLRIEVTDARGDRVPEVVVSAGGGRSEGGRGLLIVRALADCWGVDTVAVAPCKTVWAELRLRSEGEAR